MIDADGNVWKRLRRWQPAGTSRFLTFSCTGRLPLFRREETRDRFLFYLDESLDGRAIELLAFVVMPEHVHLLVRPGPDGGEVAVFLKRLKMRFAYETLQIWRESRPAAYRAVTGTHGMARFWLPGGGFDRAVRSEDAFWRHRTYIHQNPVKRGLVERAEDYRWSSAWRRAGNPE